MVKGYPEVCAMDSARSPSTPPCCSRTKGEAPVRMANTLNSSTHPIILRTEHLGRIVNQKILVEDVPAVFVYHGREVQFIKPWLLGDFIAPDSHGIAAVHWPGYATMTEIPQQLYIGASATNV